jgi:hypothetical protein
MCAATLVFPCKVPLHLGHSRVLIWRFEDIRDLIDLSRFIIGCSLYDRVVVSASGIGAGPRRERLTPPPAGSSPRSRRTAMRSEGLR